MALKFRVNSKDEIPADQQALYVERDGGWVLDVEGAVAPASVEELRRLSFGARFALTDRRGVWMWVPVVEHVAGDIYGGHIIQTDPHAPLRGRNG